MPKVPSQPNPAQQPQLVMGMTDDAFVNFTGLPDPNTGDVPFLDRGYMPVNQLTLSGSSLLHVPGGLDGVFIHYYDAVGVQHSDIHGLPTAIDYSHLKYELVGYKGTPTFSPAVGVTGTVSGIKQVVIAQGDLIKDATHVDHLQFSATGIDGHVFTSVQIGGQPVGEFDIKIHHELTDIGGNPAAGSFTLKGGDLQATFIPLHS